MDNKIIQQGNLKLSITEGHVVSATILPTFEISKKFRFETAHRLAKGYKGKCAHLHGHSWNGKIVVSLTELDDQGMTIDFAELGTFCKMIEDWLDHKTMLHVGDSDLITSLVVAGNDIVTFEDNPTSEIVAMEIYSKALTFFKDHKGVRVVQVSLEETCTSECTYKG